MASVELPDGLRELARYSDTLVDFARDPIGFIREDVLTILADALLSLVFGLLGTLDQLFGTLLRDVFGRAGTAVLGSLQVIGSIPLMLLGVLNDLLVALASVGGPAAPVIYAVAWAILMIVALELLRALWSLIITVT